MVLLPIHSHGDLALHRRQYSFVWFRTKSPVSSIDSGKRFDKPQFRPWLPNQTSSEIKRKRSFPFRGFAPQWISAIHTRLFARRQHILDESIETPGAWQCCLRKISNYQMRAYHIKVSPVNVPSILFSASHNLHTYCIMHTNSAGQTKREKNDVSQVA
jgi:hypothetical protein